jgi:hypothetical protein
VDCGGIKRFSVSAPEGRMRAAGVALTVVGLVLILAALVWCRRPGVSLPWAALGSWFDRRSMTGAGIAVEVAGLVAVLAGFVLSRL